MSRAILYSMNPVAIAFFAAAYMEKQMRFLLLVSTLAGIALWMPLTAAIKYAVIIAVFVMVIFIIERRNIKLHPLAGAAIASLVTILGGLVNAINHTDMKKDICMALLEGAVIITLYCVFHKAIIYIETSKKGQILDNEEIISMAIMMALLVYAIPDVPGVQFSFVETIAYFCVLFMGYKYGTGVGAVCGTACGLVLYLQQGDNNLIGILCLLGICAGVFRNIGKIGTAAAYVITTIGIGYFIEKQLLGVGEVRALASAVCVFAVLPKKIVAKVDLYADKMHYVVPPKNVQEITQDKLQDFSTSFQKLSKTFYSLSETKSSLGREDINQIFDELSDKLCKNCAKCSYCWKNNFYDTYKAAFSILSAAEQNGEVMETDIPISFSNQCINLSSFLYETNRGLEVAKMNLRWYNKMAESREAIAGQLGEVATIINDFSKNLYDEAGVPRELQEKIMSRFHAAHIEVANISLIERGDKKKDLYITARTRSGRCMTTREAAILVSEIVGKRLKPGEGVKNIIPKEFETVVFTEDTNFKTLTGIAKAARSKEKVSGDNFSFLYLENGEMIMTLSDGMGTGLQACEESESVVELLEQFMEAGFKEQSAIRLINSILVLKSDQQSCSTIDTAIINLFTGMCEFIKIGAAATFIKRDEWVETITSTSLPVGVFNQVDIDGVSKKLYDGDIVVMLTDGVLDCIPGENKEKYIEEFLLEIKVRNPQEIADEILEHVKGLNNGEIVDDMTVIVAGLWKK
ncbi:stage II sporulation serine phosphatase for sigma-F activation [Lachnospiraceae bacterium KM106-2]|nr:stage II sporulation serine phosphatase for sigma-F activation [Lachnospiraceae bacterium KM106-2]